MRAAHSLSSVSEELPLRPWSADFGSVGDHERDIVPAKQQVGLAAAASTADFQPEQPR